MSDLVYDPLVVDLIAQAAHEANRAWCAINGDFTQYAWPEAPMWQKDSARAGVRAALERELTPEQQHEAWCADKVAAGWTYGDVKLEGLKKHPCLRPYADLPELQRAKDVIFTSVVAAFKAALRMRVV